MKLKDATGYSISELQKLNLNCLKVLPTYSGITLASPDAAHFDSPHLTIEDPELARVARKWMQTRFMFPGGCPALFTTDRQGKQRMSHRQMQRVYAMGKDPCPTHCAAASGRDYA